MRPHHEPNGLCSVDPISLTGLALGALAGGGAAAGASALAGGGSTPAAPATPPTPAQAAPPQQTPQGTKPTPTSNTPTFLGAAATPPLAGAGGKTLLGQ